MKGIPVQPFSTNFQRGVASAKKLGGRFDPSGKVWVLPASVSLDGKTLSQMQEDGTLADVLKGWKLKLASGNGASVANTYRGQASLDHDDSIF
jgi:hypothetical protein